MQDLNNWHLVKGLISMFDVKNKIKMFRLHSFTSKTLGNM